MKRLVYIDALRAFSMFLIVYSHINKYGLQANISIFNEWSNSFMVPLFFFISGFVSYKVKLDSAKKQCSKQILKFHTLVISPLIFLFAYCLYRGDSFAMSLGDPLKNGYWFTIVLFQISLIVILVSYLRKYVTSNPQPYD